jgi:hypothetical protein
MQAQPGRLRAVPPLTAMDEYLVHQLPEPRSQVQTHHHHWRESRFFIAHRPDELGDLLVLTVATYPQRRAMDSLQMERVGGERIIGFQSRPHDGDPHTLDVGAARVEVVRPYEECCTVPGTLPS